MGQKPSNRFKSLLPERTIVSNILYKMGQGF